MASSRSRSSEQEMPAHSVVLIQMSNSPEDVTPRSRGAIAPEFCFGITLENKRAQGRRVPSLHP